MNHTWTMLLDQRYNGLQVKYSSQLEPYAALQMKDENTIILGIGAYVELMTSFRDRFYQEPYKFIINYYPKECVGMMIQYAKAKLGIVIDNMASNKQPL